MLTRADTRSVFSAHPIVGLFFRMDNTRQPGQSGNKTPIEDRPGANSQERDVSDEEKIGLSDPGTDVEQQEYEIDVPAVNQGNFGPSR